MRLATTCLVRGISIHHPFTALVVAAFAMRKSQLMNITTKLKITAAPIALGLAMLAQPLLAQESKESEAVATDDSGDDSSEELIIVTGSRIASRTIESVSPLQTVSVEAIQDSGATNIQEILLENPVFGSPGLSRTNSAFLTSGTGVASIDLRDLGSERTLVLINGRRVVSSLPGSSTIDLNSIPTQMLERVDVLTGGASSLYGSDAVAGVVNFIYKKDFEGLALDGRYGLTAQGDDQKYELSATFGGNFNEGRGNITAHIGYSNESGLLSSERSNTRVDDFSKFRLTNDPADFAVSIEPFQSSFPAQGRFTTGGNSFTFDRDGQLKTGFSTNGPDIDGDGFGDGGPEADGFNRQQFRTIAVPVERYLFVARGHYDVNDDITAWFDGTYSKTKSSRQIEPFALGSDNIFPASGGLVPIETLVNGVLMVNPLVPDAIVAAATDGDGDGLRDFGFARRLNEFGPRRGKTSRDSFRFAIGLEGTVFDERFSWDVGYSYGTTSENQFSQGQVNVLNFRQALTAVTDVDDLNENGLTNDVICADANAREQGCVPINIFGAGNISEAAINYIDAGASFQTDISQRVFSGNLSGSLIELPAGPLEIGVGFEYRQETSAEEYDALSNAGLNAGNAIPDTSGSFNVTEGYAEVRLPILADQPFFHALTATGSGRIGDYSTVGRVYSYSASLVWAPVEDFRFRGSYARAVRAPNISEIFQGRSQTFPSGLSDPCLGIGLTGGGAIGDNCRDQPGVLANIAANGTFTLTQGDLQGISGFDSGSRDLREEKSDSYTIGMVVNPRSIYGLENLLVEIDYWNISIDDAIIGRPRQFTLDQCHGEGDSASCALITRRPFATATNSVGSIEYIDSPLGNSGGIDTAGLDIVVSYRFDLEDVGLPGRLSTRVSYTRLFNYETQPTPDGDIDRVDGEIGNSKDRFTASLKYDDARFKWSWTGTYMSGASEDDQFLKGFDLNPGDISIGAEFYLDTQLAYKLGERFELYFGVDNLLDNDAPILLSGTTFNTTGTDTDAGVYDAIGRRFYSGVRLKF